MALSIKTDEADALARELAAATHESLTEAVTVALRERLERIRGVEHPSLREAIDRIAVDYAAGEIVDRRTPEEIIAYGPSGAPV